LLIEFRWTERIERLSALAAELVHLKVDVIFAPSSTETGSARLATSTIPIIFAIHHQRSRRLATGAERGRDASGDATTGGGYQDLCHFIP
jgi:hypothetical protein